ncbi:hypothetical protein NAP1_12863 [Erythrobacter sp. NAP1]|uniref:DUF1993 domain-containing protein n=1 Tax=Erythrobacter sp. NAP1 TaxID=237727 RepID=UPI0000687728|nr:DUF1993 domain-containing protein [Erythrobacter sp. NAP1]EAQ28490.1 hypothetical protein NAP1_12863 [Erythrobacter sp. NAP1]
MTLHQQSIAVYRTRLDTLAALLTKAESHPKGDALLEAKLAEDMHPLATQVRFVANLPGEALPRLTERSFTSREENATTLAEAKAQIAETAELLDSIDPDELVGTEDTIVLDLPNGMQFTMTAEQYVREWSLPNFYFHLTTAYALLRMAGLEIGKADFMPHMMKYMTKGPG